MGITGANDTAARHMLELCGSDLEQAVQLWYTDEDLQRTLSNPAPSTTAPGPSADASQPSRSSRNRAGREDAQGVIHLESDDDDDIQMTEDEAFGRLDDANEVAAAVQIARTAQEEEDAAMAKRLQEELYGGPAADEDGVRAPMARITETLVAPSGAYGGDDDSEAILEQMRRRRPAPCTYSRHVWCRLA